MNNPAIEKDTMAEYGADTIKVLEGLEAVRKRPAMYVGSTGSPGLHHLVYEVVDNSVDEALAGYCSDIHVIIHSDNSITVTDNGRGIPTGIHSTEGISAATVVLTKLHAGGKFENSAYKVSGGLHGVGVSCVNALSENLEMEIKREGKVYQQSFMRGDPVEILKEVGVTDQQGTKIWFKPDTQIFEFTEYNFDTLSQRLRELAFLNKGVHINITDERTKKEHDFLYDGGLKSFVEYLIQRVGVDCVDPFFIKPDPLLINRTPLPTKQILRRLINKSKFFLRLTERLVLFSQCLSHCIKPLEPLKDNLRPKFNKLFIPYINKREIKTLFENLIFLRHHLFIIPHESEKPHILNVVGPVEILTPL